MHYNFISILKCALSCFLGEFEDAEGKEYGVCLHVWSEYNYWLHCVLVNLTSKLEIAAEKFSTVMGSFS